MLQNCCTSSFRFKGEKAGGQKRKPGKSKKDVRMFHWLATGIAILFVPKCLICLSAYFALGTGIGFTLMDSSTQKDENGITLCSTTFRYFSEIEKDSVSSWHNFLQSINKAKKVQVMP